MGDARRRKLLSTASRPAIEVEDSVVALVGDLIFAQLEPQPVSGSALKKIAEVPQLWSISYWSYLQQDGILWRAVLFQGQASAMQSLFMDITGRTPSQLSTMEETGKFVIKHPYEYKHLALLRSDVVHTYLRDLLAEIKSLRLRLSLSIEQCDDDIAEAKEFLTSLVNCNRLPEAVELHYLDNAIHLS